MPDSFDQYGLQAAQHRLDAGDCKGALHILNTLLHTSPQRVSGIHALRGEALAGLGNTRAAVQTLDVELAANPDNPPLRQRRDALAAQLPRRLTDPRQRTWATAVTDEQYKALEEASNFYNYRGLPLIKNVFDLALYPRLLQELRPATIVEVGTFFGGSAIWLADLSRALRFPTHIYTVDVAIMHVLDDERVTYLRGSGRDLGATFSPELLAALPRPLLVIEDADHEGVTTLAVLNFFHPHLRSGEYVVVEDCMSAAGPRDALAEFFRRHGDEYEVDGNYCDFFAHNATWCINGFLRKR